MRELFISLFVFCLGVGGWLLVEPFIIRKIEKSRGNKAIFIEPKSWTDNITDNRKGG